ncbi:hypothetical protein ACW5WQ_04025 [Aeromonas rivuli]|uniref:hypothetical protein n=1 Tax=Aeromonas rivuli TaxID=648794 RepID=UPI000A491CB4|nr:hypothetical protein [Aeromonas rivuli]
MIGTLASLDEALLENARLMEDLLQQQRYDEALLCMDDRQALIGCLVQLAKDDPSQQHGISTLAARVSIQEESMTALATHHHQAIFKQLAQVGRASKAEQAYRVNSKEF